MLLRLYIICLLLAVLRGADIHHLAEHAAEVGCAGKAGVLGSQR